MEQYEAFSIVGQIRKLQELQTLIQAHNVSQGKGVRGTLSSIDRKIAILRRGAISEQDMVEAELDSQFGRAVGLTSDQALESIGFEKRE